MPQAALMPNGLRTGSDREEPSRHALVRSRARSPDGRPHIRMPDWLTWAEAAEKLGLSPGAIRMRARRLGWRTQPGNDGRTLVMVPDDADVLPREPAPEHAASIVRLTELLALADARTERADWRANLAEKRAEQAELRADAAMARVDQAAADRRAADARADRSEQALTAERAKGDMMRAARDALASELDVVRQEAAAAQGEAAELRRAEMARRLQGRWTRLRQAWCGE